jgi:hypothetical protein
MFIIKMSFCAHKGIWKQSNVILHVPLYVHIIKRIMLKFGLRETGFKKTLPYMVISNGTLNIPVIKVYSSFTSDKQMSLADDSTTICWYDITFFYHNII